MNSRRDKLNNYIALNVTALCFGMSVMVATVSSAQQQSAQPKSAKLEEIARYLNLAPEQKDKVLSILDAEVPKVRAVKDDHSLSKTQRAQKVKAIHQQNDPQLKTILSPEQYQKLQAMRHKSISDVIH